MRVCPKCGRDIPAREDHCSDCGAPTVSDAERYKKEQDLIFQEMEEKAKLKEQAESREFAVRMGGKLSAAGVSVEDWAGMVLSGKTPTEIDQFLEARILDIAVKDYMVSLRSQGKAISAENARAIILRLRAYEDEITR